METSYYTLAAVIFVLITITLYVLLLAGINGALKRMNDNSRVRKVSIAAVILLTWLGALALAASKGFFEKFDSMPPRFAFALLPPLIAIAVLMRSKKIGVLLDHIPPQWLVYPQSFRIPLEIVLWLLFIGNIIPVQMTFEGYNWDIISGITALLIGFFCFTRPRWPRAVAVAWNVIGLLLVVNIVTISILSAPVPFRVFMNEPANTIVAGIPFVWLPAFVVPFALALHFLSLRQLLRKNQ